MNNNDFTTEVERMLQLSRDTLVKKATEYASDTDRLHNFKQGAGLQKRSQKQTLLGFLTKHIISVVDMLDSDETFSRAQWDEKLGDFINYALIASAMVEEEGGPGTAKAKSEDALQALRERLSGVSAGSVSKPTRSEVDQFAFAVAQDYKRRGSGNFEAVACAIEAVRRNWPNLGDDLPTYSIDGQVFKSVLDDDEETTIAFPISVGARGSITPPTKKPQTNLKWFGQKSAAPRNETMTEEERQAFLKLARDLLKNRTAYEDQVKALTESFPGKILPAIWLMTDGSLGYAD